MPSSKFPPAPQETPPPPPTMQTDGVAEVVVNEETEPNENDVQQSYCAQDTDIVQPEDVHSIQGNEIEIPDPDLPAIETSPDDDVGTGGVDSPIESSQNPIQQVVFASWTTAFSRLFNPFNPKPLEPDLETGTIKDADLAEGDDHITNQESPLAHTFENLKNTLSKILPLPASSNTSVDYSRRNNWWMPQNSINIVPSWMPGHQASAQFETSPAEAAPINAAGDVNQNSAEDSAQEMRDARLDIQPVSKPVKRRPRSLKGANLPLTIRIAYRELRSELWGEVGPGQDEEAKAVQEEKRKQWIQRFRDEGPDRKGALEARQDALAAERFSGRIVHLLLMPCVCSGGFVLYLALAYGLFPLTAE